MSCWISTHTFWMFLRLINHIRAVLTSWYAHLRGVFFFRLPRVSFHCYKTRISIPKNVTEGRLCVLGLYDGKQDDVGFTISAFSNGASLSWDEARSQKILPCVKKMDGSFTTKTAGGNSTYPSFMVNPQYRLRIHPIQPRDNKVQISLTLKGNREVPFNVLIARSDGRIHDLARKDLVLHSGSYSYGVARASGELSPGDYTIAVSTFEPQQLGEFSLLVESSHPADVSDIPLEGAGMYCHAVKGMWDESNGTGGPSFKQYSRNPIYELSLPNPGQIKVRLQVLEPSLTTYLNVSVYSPGDASALGKLQSTSGTYSNTNSGVVTTQVQLPPGTYWVIPSTFTPGTLERFKLLVYSSVRGVTVRLRDPL
jgi:calpain-7